MISIAVLIYQLLFVGVIYVASRLGTVPLHIALVACLLWTVTHLFFVPLAVVPPLVLVGRSLYFTPRRQQRLPRSVT